MNVENEYGKDLIAFVFTRTVAGVNAMTPDEREREFLNFAPMVYPVLEALPDRCTRSMLDNNEVDFRHAAAVTLVMLTEQRFTDMGLSQKEIYEHISDENLANMAEIHNEFAKVLVELIGLYELHRLEERLPSMNLDEELKKLLGDQ